MRAGLNSITYVFDQLIKPAWMLFRSFDINIRIFFPTIVFHSYAVRTRHTQTHTARLVVNIIGVRIVLGYMRMRRRRAGCICHQLVTVVLAHHRFWGARLLPLFAIHRVANSYRSRITLVMHAWSLCISMYVFFSPVESRLSRFSGEHISTVHLTPSWSLVTVLMKTRSTHPAPARCTY
jgi:hypothetical protein